MAQSVSPACTTTAAARSAASDLGAPALAGSPCRSVVTGCDAGLRDPEPAAAGRSGAPPRRRGRSVAGSLPRCRRRCDRGDRVTGDRGDRGDRGRHAGDRDRVPGAARQRNLPAGHRDPDGEPHCGLDDARCQQPGHCAEPSGDATGQDARPATAWLRRHASASRAAQPSAAPSASRASTGAGPRARTAAIGADAAQPSTAEAAARAAGTSRPTSARAGAGRPRGLPSPRPMSATFLRLPTFAFV